MQTLATIILFFFFFLQTITAQVRPSNDTLHWKENKPLAWEDFKGKPKGGGLTGEAFCMLQAKYEKPNPLKKTKYKVFAVWDRGKSWISPKAKSHEELLYYQTLYNLYEVHARKLRKELSETKFGTDPDKVFQQKYNTALNELNDECRDFRDETKEGADIAELKKWDAKIQKELKNLEQYRE